MDIDAALNRFCTQNVGIGLLVDYLAGATVKDLAAQCGKPETWVRERIEAARLCLQGQIAFEFAGTAPDLTAA